MTTVPVKQGSVIPIPGYPVTSQTVSYTASSVATANGFGSTSRMVRLRATTDCFIAFGSAPTATSSSHFLSANETQDFAVTPGDKVAAIRLAVSGTLYVTEFRTID